MPATGERAAALLVLLQPMSAADLRSPTLHWTGRGCRWPPRPRGRIGVNGYRVVMLTTGAMNVALLDLLAPLIELKSATADILLNLRRCWSRCSSIGRWSRTP